MIRTIKSWFSPLDQTPEPSPTPPPETPAFTREDFLASLDTEAKFAEFFNFVLEGGMKRFHHRIFWGDRLLTIDKNAGFFDDPRFLKAYQHIRGSHLYDAYNTPHTIAWRLHTLVWAAQKAVQLPGDFVECGVFKGDMSWVVTQMVDLAAANKTLYLYDSFEGFSKDYSSAADFPDSDSFFDFANSVYADPSLYPLVVDKFKNMPFVRVIKGFIPESFAQGIPERISYLHIDLNSPAAEIAALEILFDRVVPGGVIVFDDYGWYNYRKQKEAEDAFFAKRGYTILEMANGQGLLIKQP